MKYLALLILSPIMFGSPWGRLAKAETLTGNILTQKWSGEHGGVPPFDRVKLEDFIPAFEEAMKQNRSEIEAIASNPSEPSFDNTIVAMERAGEVLNRVNTIYGVWSSNLQSPAFQIIKRK